MSVAIPLPAAPKRRSPVFAACLLWLVVLLAGCPSVRLVGDYDEVLDRSVMDLQMETARFFAQFGPEAESVTTGQLRPFLEKSIGTVEALAARAAVLEEGLKRTPLTENLEALRQQFESLKSIDLGPPPVRESARKAMNESFKALQVQLVYMRKAGTQRAESP